MLAAISGTLGSVEGGVALVSLSLGDGSLTYEALVSPCAAERLAARRGQRVSLHTIELLESPNQGASFVPRLLAFETREDRAFFELLTKVKGLGPRRALRALAAPTGEIARAIVERDIKALTRLPEIGKKLAEAIVAEIGEKAGAFAAMGADIGPGGARPTGAVVEVRSSLSRAAEQAVVALVRLGESRPEAERMVERVAREADETPDAILAAALAFRGV